MNLRPILFVEGIFVMMVGTLMLIPSLVDFSCADHGCEPFLIGAALALFFGSLMVCSSLEGEITLTLRQGLLLTASSWVVISAVAAVPLALSLHISFTDAFFETMSGLTTTGSTVLSNLDTMDRGVLIWRSILQWIGGVGIIVIAVAVLPFLRVGGMQLFKMESSERSDKVFPRAGQLAGAIAIVYISLTAMCAFLYDMEGMTTFEAINHAMTTLSTGGFSTSDKSMGLFQSPGIIWTSTIFMALGGIPFVLYIRSIHGKWSALFESSQVRVFLLFLVCATLMISLWLVIYNHFDPMEALRLSAFNVVSVVTTTGYATADYSLWGTFPVVVFFFLMFVGGCTGSTAGGIKIFRFEIMCRFVVRQLQILLHPSRAATMRYNNREVTDDVMRSTVLFVFQFIMVVALLALALAFTGLDLITSLTGALTAVANVGPGLGQLIGPAGNFASLPDFAKWALAFGMLVGRLEILTVLVLFSRHYWQD
jgi:trk system potassium uptake protein TrkH